MLEMQITVHSLPEWPSISEICILLNVNPVGAKMNGILYSKMSIQNIKIHGSIRHDCAIEIQSFKFPVEVYFTRCPSFYIICNRLSYNVPETSDSVHLLRYLSQAHFPVLADE